MQAAADVSAWTAIALMLVCAIGIWLKNLTLIGTITGSPVFAGLACLANALLGRQGYAVFWMGIAFIYLFMARSTERRYLRKEPEQ